MWWLAYQRRRAPPQGTQPTTSQLGD
uniref:Uncharacterized protein n=1 Tax=Arundo donax TaxID=35708 RepID=A0A0A9BRF6_ARUDO